MISGFNTDIKVGNTVYHVQTEDKGQKSALVLSLIYDRGTILASKRVDYDDVFKGADFDEKRLAEHVNRQHQLICAAVSAGRIEDLKAMTEKARIKSAANPQVSVVAEPMPVSPVARATNPGVDLPPPPPAYVPVVIPPETHELDDLIIDAVEIIDEPLLEATAVEILSDIPIKPVSEKLVVDILGESKFKGGDRKSINILISRGSKENVVKAAQIMVKVLGSTFRPVIFHARSDANGLAKVHLQIPKFEAGRAALLIRVIADGEEVEFRRVVSPA